MPRFSVHNRFADKVDGWLLKDTRSPLKVNCSRRLTQLHWQFQCCELVGRVARDAHARGSTHFKACAFFVFLQFSSGSVHPCFLVKSSEGEGAYTYRQNIQAALEIHQ